MSRYKCMVGCATCGVKGLHPVQYDFDHVDPLSKRNRKIKSNTRAIEPSWSLTRIKEEIRLCQVLCKNCHALKTYQERDYLNHTNSHI